jgi:aromatic amino acid aminotransferase I / 2-aminoadipate transaminase
MEIKVPAVGRFSEEETKESGVALKAGKYDLAEGKSLYGRFEATAASYRTLCGADWGWN